jgi:hypothetical protein
MKKIFMFLVASILMLLTACNEEQPTKVESEEIVLSITHRFYKGECLSYCDTKLILDSNKVFYIQDGWNVDSKGVFTNLPRIDSVYSINKLQWERLTSHINMNEIIKLDSAYMYDDEGIAGVSEGFIELEIISTHFKKKIKFFNLKFLNPIDSLNKSLINLRKDL